MVVVDVLAGADVVVVVAGLVVGDVVGGAVVIGGHDVAAVDCPAPASNATPTARATTTGTTACRRQRTATTSSTPRTTAAAATRIIDVFADPVAGRAGHGFIAAPPTRHPP